MHRTPRPLLKLSAHVGPRLYTWRERRRAALPPDGRPLTIAFSERESWERMIREGFDDLPHRLEFLDLRSADLERFDLIVPLSLDDAQFLRGQPAHVRERVVPLPDEACTALCHDKPRLNRKLIESGFSAHVPPMGDEVPPPYVCKPALGENSQFCVLVPDGATEQRLATELHQPGLFHQAAVPGYVEYATHFVMHERRLVRELTVCYHHDSPLYIKHAGSDASICTLGQCPDARTLEAMLRAIGYDGLGCANLKVDASGTMQLIEFNPRLGGSLCRYFFSFLRSMPRIWRTRGHGCTNWTWLDSLYDREAAGRGA